MMHIYTRVLPNTQAILMCITSISTNFTEKLAETALMDVTDQLNTMTVRQSSLINFKRKFENENDDLKIELEKAIAAAAENEEHAQGALKDVSCI